MPSKFYNVNSTHQGIRLGGFLLLFIIVANLSSFAQIKGDEDMARDERGKYIYYEVVNGTSAAADTLRARALEFLKLKKVSHVKSANEQITASGKFLISKTAFVLTHPSGEVLYNFYFEIKGDKYRFWLTDFSFIPYKRDRYANFVPATTKSLPLETEPGKLNAGEWKSYISVTNKQATAFAADFKEFLSSARKSKVQPKAKPAISTKSW